MHSGDVDLSNQSLISLVYDSDCDPEEFDPGALPPDVLTAIEADSFWCLSRLLDGIQDNYISQQPGIQRSVKRMHDLVGRIDGAWLLSNLFVCLNFFSAPLSAHLEQEGVEFMQFAFRWMNCLLMREITVKNTIRMWDTYLVRSARLFQSSLLNDIEGRRTRGILSVSSLRLLCISRKVECEAA